MPQPAQPCQRFLDGFGPIHLIKSEQLRFCLRYSSGVISLLGHNTFGYLDEDTVAFLEDANPVYTPSYYSGTLIRTMEG